MNWRTFRIAIVFGMSIVAATSYNPTVTLESTSITLNEQLKSLLFVALASSLMLLLVIGFQAVNPFSSKVWIEPSWNINPFTLSQPLVFFHFAAWIVTVQAIVNLIVSIFLGYSYWLSLIGVVVGLSVFAGLKMARVVFRHKFRKQSIQQGV
ncbi:hypothetical protein BIT28_24485 [Photobacterium proteolyticum]|uniref:Uncharacterized protein n=1 Tax=Photobacterium proteolyticum TaxID=1903952 RepID=A0A1Q9GCQ6_9GAMM|nr:hypothetical protein [Photobacterium proteolyticum]OLQ72185.1 hypothetical protein BIT28_24485 [Photobacterium proteolyticum]